MILRSVLLSLAVLAALLPSASGQDVVKPDKKGVPSKDAGASKDALQKVIQKAQEEYRTFFKEPKTALEFWAAATFEIQVGKFDVAAYHLAKLLAVPENELDEDLLKIEEAEGFATFLRLRLVKEWHKQAELEAEARKNVDALIDRVVSALDKRLGDRERNQHLIEGLFDKVPEVRGYALLQLKRAKHRAAPVLAEALRSAKPPEQRVLRQALLQLDPEIMPPLLELYRPRDAKEASDVEFLSNLLWLAKARLEKRVIPSLWYLSSALQYPKVVRDQARDTLAYLLETPPDLLPPAKFALTQLAEKYYQYKVRLPDVTEVADRDNPAKQLVMPAYKKWYVAEDGRLKDKFETLRPDDARFEFGLRYARQALELDKSYRPAQALYLAFLLEAEFARPPYDGQLDKLLTQPAAPGLRRLLAKIDLDLLTTVLERAIEEQNYAVALPLIDAAGDRGEVRMAQPSGGNSPGLLVRLLYDPDRRVQYAAARALLRLPAAQSPVASARIVEVLGRFLATETAPKVLIVHAANERSAQLRSAAQEAGFASDVAANAREALELLHASAAYDAILVNDGISDSELPFVLKQLRSDQDAGRLPLLLIASPDRQAETALIARRLRNAFLLPAVQATNGPELKRKIEDAIKFAVAPLPLQKAPEDEQPWLQYEVRRAKGQAVAESEKKRFARDALDWFAQMARGELPGYDLTPARTALLQALNNDEMAVQALRIIARYQTVEAQRRLADMLFDPKRASLHVLACQELNRNIQRNGLALTADQIGRLQQLEQQPDVPAPLRVELATVVGALRTTPQMTGSRLLHFGPEPQAAAAKKDEK